MQDEIIKIKFIESQSEDSDAKRIKKWLILVFLKRIFGGQSDSVLVEIRKIMRESSSVGFPLDQIMTNAKGNPTKNYIFDEEFIDGLFEVQCGSPDAFFVLSLFYPDLDYFNQNFHIDHVHPKSKFIDKKYMKNIFTLNQIESISINYNKLGNLQLLNNEKNISKSDKSLKQWVEEKELSNSFLFVDEEIDLEMVYFEKFYDNRRENMKKRLIELVR